ncbi:MAG: CBS domain-containing protein [Blastococcus sp.]
MTSPPAVETVMRPAATTVEASAHLAAAAYLMKRSGHTAVVVTSDDGNRRPLAVLTETDVSRAVADGRDVEETRIRDLASPPTTVEPHIAVDEAARLMLLRKVHHLPVVEGGRLVGIVDITDLCRVLVNPHDGASD